MSVLQGFLFGLLQGIAEFLPISSSGHLEVCKFIFKLDDVPILFDVFLHIATLLAVIIYFRKTIARLFGVLFRFITKQPETQAYNVSAISSLDSKLETLAPNDEVGRKTILMIIITTIITGVIGVVNSKLLPDLPLKLVAVGFLVTSALLITSSIFAKKKGGIDDYDARDDFYNVHDKSITWIQAIIIGIAQGIGTLPGISRSGSTIAGALFCGVDRKTAGDYSFIVSIPAVLGAFVLTFKDAIDEAKLIGSSLSEYFSLTVGFLPAIVGFVSAFVFGYLALFCLMKLIHKGKLEYFAAYLIPLGLIGLIVF